MFFKKLVKANIRKKKDKAFKKENESKITSWKQSQIRKLFNQISKY